jgi:hypothetical protein
LLPAAAAFTAGFFPAVALRGWLLLPSGLPTLRDIDARFCASAFQSPRWQDGQRAGTLSLLREIHLYVQILHSQFCIL